MRPPDRHLFIVRRRMGLDVGAPHLLTAQLAMEDRIIAAIGVREYLDEGLSIDLFHDEPDIGNGSTRHLFEVGANLAELLVSLARGLASPTLKQGVPPEAVGVWACRTWQQAPVVFRYTMTVAGTDGPRPRIHVAMNGTWSVENVGGAVLDDAFYQRSTHETP